MATDNESEHLVEDQDLAENMKGQPVRGAHVSGVVRKAPGKTLSKLNDGGVKMNKMIKKLLTGVLIVSFVFMFAGPALAGEGVTITGTINEDNQLIDSSGDVYEVADNEVGSEVLEHVGQKVEVMGTVMEGDGGKMITITSFKVLEE